ncbi:MAG: SUMF1/EgtB/PvdO family nonheme iron enzyme, partial [Proteobacteria bacterium]|nr:SUMF1/EgtB/PvdO family nonheme iron enzyme [Pseudomonadota bacterium]
MDFDFLIQKLPATATGYKFRAIVHARMGKSDKAKNDLAKFRELSKSPSSKAYLDAVVSAHLGEEAVGMKRLELFIKQNQDKTGALYDAACAYSLCSGVFKEKDAAKSKVYADRAVALINKAIAKEYNNDSLLLTDADLDPIREVDGFMAILNALNIDRRYAAVWQTSSRFESAETHGLSPQQHLARCRELISKGYRPVAMSAASLGAKHEHVTASVWHRPLVPEDEKEQLAKRQANAAVALVKMGHAERVWPLLKHSPDPRLRTWIIHRLSPLGASPDTIVKRLNDEADISIRRALILILGEYKDASQMDRKGLSATLLKLYRDDPDPGIHGAAEWVLRRWGKAQDLARIDTEFATGKAAGKRNWYLTKQGHTMVLFRGPVEFWMGSPGTEKDRSFFEYLHRKRIGRSFVIASKEVTVKQFQKFLRNTPSVSHEYHKESSPEENCPQTGVTWYEAAAYCRWLSEQEGIPEDQMCYPPIAEIKAGMTMPSNYLNRTGYRLPTEAEWEYACRSKTVTSRYYGQTDELLGQYAWFIKNSANRSWPVGSLKPNDTGLFDMLGNVLEWCQGRYVTYSR